MVCGKKGLSTRFVDRSKDIYNVEVYVKGFPSTREAS